jgi:hypothetical protein
LKELIRQLYEGTYFKNCSFPSIELTESATVHPKLCWGDVWRNGKHRQPKN